MKQSTEVCPYNVLLPEDYTKKGTSAIVENRASAIVANPGSLNVQFRELEQDLLAAIPDRDGATAPPLRRARLRRQVGETVAYYQIYQLAIPHMAAWHRMHKTLEMPEDASFDFYEDIPWEVPDNDPPLYTRVLSNGFWMRQAAQSFLGESATDTKHPYHGLHAQLDTSWKTYVRAFRKDELRRTGESPDALWNDEKAYTYKELVTGTSHATGSQGADVIAAGAIHSILFDGATNLDAIESGITARLPHMRWMDAMSRNTGKRQAEAVGLNPLVVPREATKLLITQLTHAESLEELVEPFKQYRVMNNTKFIPSEQISNGPPSHSSTCSGDVNIHVGDPESRRNIAAFYNEIGLPKLGRSSTFSSTVLALGIGKRVGETTFMPELIDFLAVNSG